MPRKLPISLTEYVEKLNYYRLEFLKRSNEYIELKNVERSKIKRIKMLNIDALLDEILLPRVCVFLPDDNGIIDNGVLECDPHEPIDFKFSINSYASFDEFISKLNAFVNESIREFKHLKKFSYGGTQTSYILDAKGAINYFKISGKKPFSLWDRYLQAHDLEQIGYIKTKIGNTLINLYGHIECTSLIRSVSEDLKEANRLISCAKYHFFPYDKPSDGIKNQIPAPKNIRIPPNVVKAFSKKINEPSTKAVIAKLTPRKPSPK